MTLLSLYFFVFPELLRDPLPLTLWPCDKPVVLGVVENVNSRAQGNCSGIEGTAQNWNES